MPVVFLVIVARMDYSRRMLTKLAMVSAGLLFGVVLQQGSDAPLHGDESTIVIRDERGVTRALLGRLSDDGVYGIQLLNADGKTTALEVKVAPLTSEIKIGDGLSPNSLSVSCSKEGSQVVVGAESGCHLKMFKLPSGEVGVGAVDENGRKTFSIGSSRDGSSSHVHLLGYDAAASPACESLIACRGKSVRMDMRRDGEDIVQLGTLDGGAGTALHIGTKASGVEFKADSSGGATMAVKGRNGSPWVVIQSNDTSGGGLLVCDANGKQVIKLGVNPDGSITDSWATPAPKEGK